MANYYDVLKTTPGADDATLKKAYRKLALTHHPDKTLHLADTERTRREHAFKLATTAYEVLSDTGKRAAYDRTLRSSRVPPVPMYGYGSTPAQQQQPQQQQPHRQQPQRQQQDKQQHQAKQQEAKQKRPSQKAYIDPQHQTPTDPAWSEKYWEERKGRQRAEPQYSPVDKPSWGEGDS
jgi:DnaJ-class molecular chaperone